MSSLCSIELKNELSEIARLGSFIEKVGEDNNLPPDTILALLLASDELVTNVIMYGCTDAREHQIVVSLECTESSVHLIIADDGIQFDPLAAPDADTSLPLEEKKIGGLGIHLVKKMMNEVAYRYQDNKNIMSMKKYFT